MVRTLKAELEFNTKGEARDGEQDLGVDDQPRGLLAQFGHHRRRWESSLRAMARAPTRAPEVRIRGKGVVLAGPTKADDRMMEGRFVSFQPQNKRVRRGQRGRECRSQDDQMNAGGGPVERLQEDLGRGVLP